MPSRTMEFHPRRKGAYLTLLVELAINFVIMYLVMFTMIAALRHFHNNLNNVYMTLMMVAPMAVVMLLAMRHMFPSRGANLAIIAAAVAVFVLAFAAMRGQYAIGDAQFLRAMIPHHSGAILMCSEAQISDPRIADLCGRIVKSQQEEITEMEAILQSLP